MPPFQRTRIENPDVFAAPSPQGSAQIQAKAKHFGNQRVFRSSPDWASRLGQAPNTMKYQGFKFTQACPSPGQPSSWRRAERTEMHLGQIEFYKMVDERANGISVPQQYGSLSKTFRDHADQLLHEQRLSDPDVEWSCVYAKENKRPSTARNNHPDDYKTVSMVIVLMRRPIKTKPYPRTPRGEVVDLGTPILLDGAGLAK